MACKERNKKTKRVNWVQVITPDKQIASQSLLATRSTYENWLVGGGN